MNNISRQNLALVELSQCIKLSVGLLHYVVAVHCLSEVLRKMGTEELKCRDLFNIGPTTGIFPVAVSEHLCVVCHPFICHSVSVWSRNSSLGDNVSQSTIFQRDISFLGGALIFFFFNVPGVRISTNVIFSGFGSCFTLVIFWNLNQNIVLRRFCTRINYISLFLFLLENNLKSGKMTQIGYLKGTSLLKPRQSHSGRL